MSHTTKIVKDNSIRRCIQISPNGPILQGECREETIRNFNTGEKNPTGYGTIDGIFGRLIQSVRKNESERN